MKKGTRKKRMGRPPLPIPKPKPRLQMLGEDEITDAKFEEPNGVSIIKSFEHLPIEDQVSVMQELRALMRKKFEEAGKALEDRAVYIKKANEIAFHS
jgi:hypothetical protein